MSSRASATSICPPIARPPILQTPRLASAVVASAILLAILASRPAGARDPEAHWPAFHGHDGRGVGTGAPPVHFDVATGRNIAWKTPIPGLSHGSPVIWGDRVYVVTAESDEVAPELKVGLYGAPTPAKDHEIVHRWSVLAIDRASGEVAWKRQAHEGTPTIRRHLKASHANSTPATDGDHVVAFFGSEGLHCYDRDGKRLWRKDFGRLDSGSYNIPAAQWGFGNSPTIEGDRVIVLADAQKNGFLAVYELSTGREIWRVARDEVPTWTTPTVLRDVSPRQIVVNGFKHMGGYDLDSGDALWQLTHGGDVPVPRPVAGDGLVYLTNAHGRFSPILAVRPSARGTFSVRDHLAASEPPDDRHATFVAWSKARGGAYMQTPVLIDDTLFVCRDNGVVSAYDAATGDEHWKARLTTSGDGFTASGVAAGGHLYYPSETGTVYVVEIAKTFVLAAENDLGEVTMASPALAEDAIYFRTRGHLVAVAGGPDPETAAPGSSSSATASESGSSSRDTNLESPNSYE